MKQVLISLYLVLLTLLVACDSSSGTPTTTPVAPPVLENNGNNDGGLSGTGDGSSKQSLRGAVYKGPLIQGSLIKLRRVIDGNISANEIMTNILSNKGDYAFDDLPDEFQGSIVSTLASGQYYDETRGLFSSSDIELKALIQISPAGTTSQTAYINSLTHLAHDYTLQLISRGESYEQARAMAQERVLSTLKVLTGDRNVSQSFHNMSLINTADTNESDNSFLLYISTLLLQATTEQQKTRPAFSVSELFAILIEDVINNTEIDDATLTLLQQANDQLDSAAIAQNLASILINDPVVAIDSTLMAVTAGLSQPTDFTTGIVEPLRHFCYDGATGCEQGKLLGTLASNPMYSYQLQFSNDADFIMPRSKFLDANNNAVSATSFPSTTSYARVRRVRPDGQYSRWTIISFAPPAPIEEAALRHSLWPLSNQAATL